MRARLFFVLGKTRHAQFAFFKAQIEHFVQIAPGFEQRVFAHDADIRDAVFHIGGNVRRLDEKELEFFVRRFQNELARFFL